MKVTALLLASAVLVTSSGMAFALKGGKVGADHQELSSGEPQPGASPMMMKKHKHKHKHHSFYVAPTGDLRQG